MGKPKEERCQVRCIITYPRPRADINMNGQRVVKSTATRGAYIALPAMVVYIFYYYDRPRLVIQRSSHPSKEAEYKEANRQNNAPGEKINKIQWQQ